MKKYLYLLLLLTAGTACAINANDWLAETKTVPTATPLPPQTYSVNLPSPISGLEQLNSYRINLIVDFEGTRNGQPAAGHIESLTEVNRPANILHRYLYVDTNSPGFEDEAGVSEFFRVGNRVYVSKADGDFFSFETEALPELLPGELGLLELDRLIVLPSAVTTPPQPEMLRGISVQRYIFSEADLPPSPLNIQYAAGQVWVAETSRYLVQYVISGTVNIAAPIPNAHILNNGKLNLSYTLTDTNTDFEIKLPDNIETTITPLAQFPRLEDAQITAIFPTLLEYTSAFSPISATLFYQTGLPSNGWSEDSAEIFEEKSRLIYSKDNETLTIIVAPGDQHNQIKVLLNLDTQP